MRKKQLIGAMLENNKVIARDRSQQLAYARSISDEPDEHILRRICWQDLTVVMHVKWTLQERLHLASHATNE